MALPLVHAARYVTSMREGGSLPALIEADDGAAYLGFFQRRLENSAIFEEKIAEKVREEEICRVRE